MFEKENPIDRLMLPAIKGFVVCVFLAVIAVGIACFGMHRPDLAPAYAWISAASFAAFWAVMIQLFTAQPINRAAARFLGGFIGGILVAVAADLPQWAWAGPLFMF